MVTPPTPPTACSTYDGVMPQIFAALTGVVVASPLPEASWYSAAESALTAIYALHPAPEHVSGAILKHLARQAFAGADGEAGEESEAGGGAAPSDAMDAEGLAAEEAGDGEEGEEGTEAEAGGEAQPAASHQAAAPQQPRSMHYVAHLSRFLFVLGHVALQHLVSLVGAGCSSAASGRPALRQRRHLESACFTARLSRLRLFRRLPPPRRCLWSVRPRRCGACAWSARSGRRRSGRSAWRRGAPPGARRRTSTRSWVWAAWRPTPSWMP